ncbi:MAG: hypothetical protein NTZ80_01180 [Patescibacteria group bacterium]|nr:hypothetical protein [Patescibacteria group bacterium]
MEKKEVKPNLSFYFPLSRSVGEYGYVRIRKFSISREIKIDYFEEGKELWSGGYYDGDLKIEKQLTQTDQKLLEFGKKVISTDEAIELPEHVLAMMPEKIFYIEINLIVENEKVYFSPHISIKKLGHLEFKKEHLYSIPLKEIFDMEYGAIQGVAFNTLKELANRIPPDVELVSKIIKAGDRIS